jgi:hypothetical protein
MNEISIETILPSIYVTRGVKAMLDSVNLVWIILVSIFKELLCQFACLYYFKYDTVNGLRANFSYVI